MSANAQPSNCTRSWERVLSQRFAKHFETSSELGRGSHKVFAKSADAQKQDPRFADAHGCFRGVQLGGVDSPEQCAPEAGVVGNPPKKPPSGLLSVTNAVFGITRLYSDSLGFTRKPSEAAKAAIDAPLELPTATHGRSMRTWGVPKECPGAQNGLPTYHRNCKSRICENRLFS